MLKREGYEVLSAERPRYALEIVATTSPVDLVVSDIVMPEMQGTQLVREVARLSPQIASVLMTGGVISADLPIGVPVLKKPFTRQDLLSAVQEALESSLPRRGPISDASARFPPSCYGKARNSAPRVLRPFGIPMIFSSVAVQEAKNASWSSQISGLLRDQEAIG
jgi:DNA-binding NtrC family response regulator